MSASEKETTLPETDFHTAKQEQTPEVWTDYDKTYQPLDSGELALIKALGWKQEDFYNWADSIERQVEPGHSNQLVYFLENTSNQVRNAVHEAAQKLNLQPREGFEALMQLRDERNLPNGLSSAGYKGIIEPNTNGVFDQKIIGELTEQGPVYNGGPEKWENLSQTIDAPYIFLGDSNGDLAPIQKAPYNQGVGIAIGSSGYRASAQRRVDEATFYANDSEEHYTTAAFVEYLAAPEEHRIMPQKLREKYGFDYSNGEIVPGENATQKDKEVLREFEAALE